LFLGSLTLTVEHSDKYIVSIKSQPNLGNVDALSRGPIGNLLSITDADRAIKTLLICFPFPDIGA
jgi:hypothetical protein